MDQVCRILFTNLEAKEKVTEIEEGQEGDMVTFLRELSSVSAGVINKFRLNREMRGEVLRRLSANRALQSTLRSVLRAARFRYFHKGELLSTLCQYCGRLDSLQHPIRCVNVGPHREHGQGVTKSLADLARRAYNVNPKLPTPCWMDDSAEIDLGYIEGGSEDTGPEVEEDDEAFDRFLLRMLDAERGGEEAA